MPNLQTGIAEVVALFALGQGLYVGDGLLERSLVEGETGLRESMLSVLQSPVGF